MSITNDPRLDLIPERTQLLDDEIRLGLGAAERVLSAESVHRCRKDNRYPFPYLIHMTRSRKMESRPRASVWSSWESISPSMAWAFIILNRSPIAG